MVTGAPTGERDIRSEADRTTALRALSRTEARVDLSGRPLGPRPVRRGLALLLMALLVAVPVVIAGAVYSVSSRLAPTYEASSTLRIVAQGQSGISDQSVIASNDLASQYAQLGTAPSVIKRAALSLKVPSGELEGQVSAGTVAAQNLVKIAARAGDGPAAVRRADAVALAFVDYLGGLNERQANAYSRSVQRRLKPLDDELSTARRLVSTGTLSQRNSNALLYSNLLVQRQQLLASIAQDAAASQPGVQLVAQASSASKVAPRPTLYALVGLVASALIAARIGFLMRRRRNRPPSG
jgi:capsular polysaccharide biosynthesis protein